MENTLLITKEGQSVSQHDTDLIQVDRVTLGMMFTSGSRFNDELMIVRDA